jgi:MoaA/NifB/PqqE/SkfB family radical SAM enzyme
VISISLNHIIWEITNKCNLQCKHCYNESAFRNKQWEHIPLEDAKTIIDKIVKSKYDLIDFLGGEPLLYPYIAQLAKYAVSKGIKVCIVTNGTLLNDKMQRDLIESGTTMISISIDGSTPEINDNIRGEGTFNCIIKNLKNLQQKIQRSNSKTEISLGFVINKINIHQIPYLPEWVSNLGVRFLDIQHLMPAGGAITRTDELSYNWSEALKAIEKAVENCVQKNVDISFTVDSKPLFQLYLGRKYGYEPAKRSPFFCVTGTHRINILPDGKVHPCGPANILSSVAREKGLLNLEILDIRRCTLEEIQNSNYFKSAFDLAYNPETYSSVLTCEGCQFKTYPCQPCPMWVLEYNLQEMEECEYAKKRLLQLDEKILSQIPIPNSELKWHIWEQKIIIFDHSKQQFIRLEGSSFQIWIRMDGNNTVNEIINDIANQLSPNMDKDVIKKHVLEFFYKINRKYIKFKEV